MRSTGLFQSRRASAAAGTSWSSGRRRLAWCSSRQQLLRTLLLLLGCTCCTLIASNIAASGGIGSSASAAAAAADALRNAGVHYIGPVASPYNVADGYWALEVNYSRPRSPPPLLARARYHASNKSCWQLAKAHAEPFTEEYTPTGQPPTALPGGLPRAVWKWHGRISRRLFESVPFILREADVAAGCVHCTFVLRYKVLGGRLYAERRRRRRSLDGQEEEAAILEELLLAALHMYQVPDVDFLLHLGDGCPPDLPLVQVNINRSNPRAGFTLPKFSWRDALGHEQFALLAECLQARYPPLPQAARLQRAVWRGSNTDAAVSLMDEGNVLDVLRTRLHLYGRWFPALIDAHYTGFPQQAFGTQCVEELLPPGPQMPLEDANRYALLLDVDGNGWSDRYRLLAHFNTPLLKQASNLTAFFEHLAAPGHVVEHYAHDLSDLPLRAAALLDELRQRPGRLLRMAERSAGLAHFLLNPLALAQAAAYTLAKVAELSDWVPRAEDGYELVPFNRCCSHASHLPAAFIAAVAARQ